MNRIVHFEIPVEDGQRAKKFYEEVFGWKIEKWEGAEYWMVTTGPDSEPGINGGFTLRTGLGTQNEAVDSATAVNSVITIDAYSIDDLSEKIEKAGGKLRTDKMPIPGIGWLRYFSDLDGNVLGLMESDESAQM